MTESVDAIPTRSVAWGPVTWSALWPILLFAGLATGLAVAIDRQLISGQPVCDILCNIVLVAGLYLIVGLAGELSFAQLAFFAMGCASASAASSLNIVLSGWWLITLLLLLLLGVGLVMGLRALRHNHLAVTLLSLLTAWIFIDLSIGFSFYAPWLIWSRAMEAISSGWFWLTFEVVQPAEQFMTMPAPFNTVIQLALALMSGGLLIGVLSYVICRLPRYATPIVTLLFLVAVVASWQSWYGQSTLTPASAPMVANASGIWAYLAAGAVFIAWRFAGGAIGSRLHLYQHSPEVAQAIGVSLFNNRLLAFFAGSMFAFIAGMAAYGSADGAGHLPPFLMERSIGIVAMVMLIRPDHLWWMLVATIAITGGSYMAPIYLVQLGPVYAGLIIVAVTIRAVLIRRRESQA